MPTWISKDGVQKPALEKVMLTNPKTGEPYLYEGPDRAAIKYLQDNNVTELGIDFRKDPEIINRARQFNMTVDEWCQIHLNPDEKRKADFAQKEKEINFHAPPAKKKATEFRGGGINIANPKASKLGGFDATEDVDAAKFQK